VAVVPLTTAQQRAVEALMVARRLERVPVDEQRCAAFFRAGRARVHIVG
jgi:hypothetical protein